MSNDAITGTAEKAQAGTLPTGEPAPKRPSSDYSLRGRARRFSPLSLLERYTVVGVWIVMIVIYGILKPNNFLITGTFHTIFTSQQPLIFLAMALVCAFLVGEFDLSVASNLGLTATLVPVLYTLHHLNIIVAIVIALASSVIGGAVNGFLVIVVGVDPIVVTLGSGTLIYGIALGVSNLQPVSGLPSSIAKLAQWNLFGLPISFYYGAVLVIVLTYVFRYTPIGRHMVFVGSNREVARLAGIQVARIRFGAYVLSGLICGIGGVIFVCGLGGFDPNSSQSYLLPSFSAVFLGTAIVRPGTFNPIGTMIAVYFLETGIIGLQILGFSGWISQVFYGGALVVAVSVSALIRRGRSGTRGSTA